MATHLTQSQKNASVFESGNVLWGVRIMPPKHAALLLTAFALVAPTAARAACNLIPGTEISYNAELGATNRPFAAPGAPLKLRLRPATMPPSV